MKWNSLSYRQQNHLRKVYDERHADECPVGPIFKAPEQSQRLAIDTKSDTHIYAFMKEMGQRTDTPSSEGYVRIVGSTEHIEINLPIESIPAIIEELSKLHNDMRRFDYEGTEYGAQMKAYRAAKEEYEKKRDFELESLLDSGKYTEVMIETELDDIPF
jgi:hypothetical protein